MPLNPAVLERLRVVLSHFEGVVTWMYMDVKSLVSTGVGFLMEYHRDAGPGHPNVGHNWPWNGTREEFDAAWNQVKAHPELISGSGLAFAGVTTLRLTEAWVRQHFSDIADGKVAEYKKWDEMKDFDSFPLDAQLGIMVLAWGALKREWNFTKAVGRRDWRTAGRESLLDEFTLERKAALRKMFTNAAVVDDYVGAGSHRYSRSTLYYPAALTSAGSSAVRFQVAVDATDWGLAYKLLNSLTMSEMLTAIKRLQVEDRAIIWGVRDHLKGENLPVNWKRIEFAFTVVKERRIPINSMMPDIELRSGVWTDEHWGIPPNQVVEAVRFLSGR
ncbi:MAG: hypothetical protein AB2L11_01525 [Syntrophobacteraceae bacterium]